MAYGQYQLYLAPPSSGKGKEKDKNQTSKQPSSPQDPVHLLLVMSKWSFLGIYLFMEMFTMVSRQSSSLSRPIENR